MSFQNCPTDPWYSNERNAQSGNSVMVDLNILRKLCNLKLCLQNDTK